MAKEKACKKCRTLYHGSKCPKCGSEEFSDTFRGRINVVKPDKSKIAKNLKLSDKGEYTLRA